MDDPEQKQSMIFDDISQSVVGKINIVRSAESDSWQSRLSDNIKDNKVRITSALGVFADLVLIVSGATNGSWARIAGSTTAIGTTSLGLGFKPKEQTLEEIEAIKKQSPLERVKSSIIKVFKPKHHIRHTVGGGILTAGFLYVISGIQSGRSAEALYGANAMVGGSQLLFTPDDNDAWRKFGAYMGLTTGPIGIATGLQAGLQHRDWLPAVSNGTFLISNGVSYFASRGRPTKHAAELKAISSIFSSEDTETKAKMMDELNHQITITMLVTGKEAGKDHWAYVTMNPEKYLAFQEAQSKGVVDLSQYADEVLAKGEGKEPARGSRDRMRQQHDFDPQFMDEMDKNIAASLDASKKRINTKGNPGVVR